MERLFTGPATIKTLADKQGIKPVAFDFNNRDRQKLLKEIISIPVETAEGKEEAIRFLYGLANYNKARFTVLNNDNYGALGQAISTVEKMFTMNETMQSDTNSIPLLDSLLSLVYMRKQRVIKQRKEIWKNVIVKKFREQHSMS